MVNSFLIVLIFFLFCMGGCGIIYGVTWMHHKGVDILKEKTKKIYRLTESYYIDEEDESEHEKEFKPLEEWPVLSHYQKFDPLVSGFDGDIDSIENVGDIELNNFHVEALFLGMVDEETVVIYKPAEEEMEEYDDLSNIDETKNPSKVYEESFEKIVSRFVNPAAEVRKRKMDGSKSLCKLQNSGYETFRKTKAKEKRRLEAGDYDPCNEVDKTLESIEA